MNMYGNAAEWKEHGNTGARLWFAYLESDKDAMAYQGFSLTRVYIEEVGQFPSLDPMWKLMATLRSTAGVKMPDADDMQSRRPLALCIEVLFRGQRPRQDRA